MSCVAHEAKSCLESKQLSVCYQTDGNFLALSLYLMLRGLLRNYVLHRQTLCHPHEYCVVSVTLRLKNVLWSFCHDVHPQMVNLEHCLKHVFCQLLQLSKKILLLVTKALTMV